MPAAITLHQVSVATPDGRPLLSRLDLSFGPVRTGLVGRNGIGKSSLLGLMSGARRPTGGRVTVQGTVGVLRQTVQVDPCETAAGFMGIADALDRLDRLERGEGTAEDAGTADSLPSPSAGAHRRGF